jgi:hypothetical protein
MRPGRFQECRSRFPTVPIHQQYRQGHWFSLQLRALDQFELKNRDCLLTSIVDLDRIPVGIGEIGMQNTPPCSHRVSNRPNTMTEAPVDRRFNRTAEDLGNIVALKHVSVTVPDQQQFAC